MPCFSPSFDHLPDVPGDHLSDRGTLCRAVGVDNALQPMAITPAANALHVMPANAVPPMNPETGDIRATAMNRVASAVGEGSMVVRFVHEYLAMT